MAGMSVAMSYMINCLRRAGKNYSISGTGYKRCFILVLRFAWLRVCQPRINTRLPMFSSSLGPLAR